MGEKNQQLQPEIISSNAEETEKKSLFLRHYKWWFQMIIYSIFVLGGQAVGTLLGRVYYDKGGKSNWMATLVQVFGFPILIPFQFLPTNHKHDTNTNMNTNTISLAGFYLAIGAFQAVDCMLYSVGMRYLPVTTYSLICASQLGFNAVFSFFLNRQKFTPYIINSLFLLTISSVLLVFQPDDSGGAATVSKRKYAIGFACTVAASAGYAFMLSLTQLAFQKLIKKETIGAIIDMTVFQNAVATVVIVIGLFGSGDWRRVKAEMGRYEEGKVSYVMNLVWTSVSWQVFGVGCIGLIFKMSSLFSNVISILGVPVVPALAVVFLGERLTGLKAVAMVVAMWGFASYIYQHYLDDLEMKKKETVEGSGDGGGEGSHASGGVGDHISHM